ncbi:hypothetical protein BD414DRAFT_485269 [Trametes punicea]|nr:hypothetical protein BD414DRAFT_485269 [Trametes punicea]
MPEELADNGLTNHAHPRRAAARKASKLAAEQLESSPISSEAENDEAVTFGEPSTPKGGVKYTYGGKRKSKPSPSKSSPSFRIVPPRSRPRSTSLVEQSPSKLANATRGRGAPRGRRARRLSTTHKKSASIPVTVDHTGRYSPAFEKDENARQPSGSTETAASISTRHAARPEAIHASIVAGKGSKKRPLSLSSSSGGEGSPLTPLSSPELRQSSGPSPMPVLAPRLARQLMRSQHQADTSTRSNKQSTLKHSKSFDQLFTLDSTDDESFDELDVGSFAWVSINLRSKLADAGDDGDSDTVWWPAKVDLPRPCMRVSLFGEPPGFGNSGSRQLDLPTPTPSVIRSMMHSGRVRFDETNYRPHPRESLQSSPRKRRKLDLDAAWREARDLMLKADQAQSQGQGFSLSAATSKAGSSSKAGRRKAKPFPSLQSERTKGPPKAKRGKRKGRSADLSLSDLDDDDLSDLDLSPDRTWRAPSANPLLEIPGELILARDGKVNTQYWPAKILEYIKPQGPRQRPKYKVLFFDGTIMAIEPDMFWTTTDDGFATCKLGDSTGNYGLDSDIDTPDEGDSSDDFNRPFAPEDEAALRAASPLPSLPAPAPEAFEYDLSIAEQFEYVKPVLAAVLEGQYAPAMQRHEGFMRGAGIRQKVLDAVPVRGSLSAREKEEIAYLVRSWARRRERRRAMGLSTEYPQDKLYPPDGTAAGEANGHVDDSDDADSVLTPASDTSGGDTEPLGAFEIEPPPSSFVATEVDTDDDERMRNVNSDAAKYAKEFAVLGDGNSASSESNNHTDCRAAPPHGGGNVATEPIGRAESEKVVDDETSHPAPRTTFHDLDAVEKITYCNNILLQEAILQLLLWRTGQRKALGLLSPEEEQRLHDIALEEGEKTNWVHDIIRMRQAMEKSMLPTSKGKGKASEPVPGVRTRARRRG